MTQDPRAVARALYVRLYSHTHYGYELTELSEHDEWGVAEIVQAMADARQQGMEAAAVIIEGGSFLHADAPDYKWAKKVATLIRMKAQES